MHTAIFHYMLVWAEYVYKHAVLVRNKTTQKYIIAGQKIFPDVFYLLSYMNKKSRRDTMSVQGSRVEYVCVFGHVCLLPVACIICLLHIVMCSYLGHDACLSIINTEQDVTAVFSLSLSWLF